MKVKKNKINIRERLTSLLDFKQVLSGLNRAGINIGDPKRVLDIDGDMRADDYDLNDIERTLDVDAVEIYIYDTTQDSDGGAWRHQTKQNSWYNEPLDTTTRGPRREFPAVALIVAEADKLTIFDADDSELSMWMVFELAASEDGYVANALGDHRATLTCCCAKNATIVVGGNTAGFMNLWEMNLLTERIDRNYAPAIVSTVWTGDISQRNESHTWYDSSTPSVSPIDGWEIVDVDITVLPDAPVDQTTGLQVPTIVCVDNTGGVGRGGKVFVKNHHHQVITITSDDIHGQPNQVEFVDGKLMIKCGNNYDRADTLVRLIDIPAQDINLPIEINNKVLQGKRYGSGDWAYSDNGRNAWEENLTLPIWSGNYLTYDLGDARISWIAEGGHNRLFIGANQSFIQNASQYSSRDNRFYQVRYDTGLSEPGTTHPWQVSDFYDRRGVCLITTDGDQSRWSDMCAHITHNHNTGWMPGNNKLTTLCDTKPGLIGTDVTTELIPDLTQAFPVANWSVNLNDGGNFDKDSFQVNSDGHVVAVTIAAQAGQSYFKSPFISLSQLGLATDQNYRMTVKARTTSVGTQYTAYVALYQQHHGVAAGDPDGSDWSNGASSKGGYKALTNQSTTFELDFRSSDHAEDFLSVYFFLRNAAADQEIVIEEISIKRTDNLVFNGDFTEYSSDPNIVLGWRRVDGETSQIVNDQLELHRTTDSTDLVSQLVHVTPDTQHVISFEVNKSTTSSGFLVIAYVDPESKTPVGAFVESETITLLPYLPAGKYSIPFYPTQDKVWVMFKCNDVGTCLIDNVTCKIAERDRSSIGHGLFVNGQIEKSPVAPGAELVAYHGFTTDNYISQHFNHEMYFGNSDWYMSFWFKKEPGGGQYQAAVAITGTDFETSSTGGAYEWPYGGYISTYIEANTKQVMCSFRGSNDQFYTTNGIDYVESQWQHVMYMRRGDELLHYMNGNLIINTNISGTERTPFAVFARKLYIGKNILAQTPTGTDAQFAMVKAGAGAPTEQQVKQIFQDESRLFQAGAKCTLQHDSDNVHSICHDPDNMLLHVGTNTSSSQRDGVTTFDNLIVHDQHVGPARLIASKSNIYIQQ